MKKTRGFLVMLILGYGVVFCFAQSSERAAYIDKYQHIAVEEMERTGVPASIKLAQACLESSNGKSILAVKGNNHFGIKCGGHWEGETIYREDDDYVNGVLIKSCFRKYKDAEESFVAHSEFLKGKERYAFLFDFEKTAYKQWAHGLKKAGYATNPKYPELLIKIIETNKLDRFDKMTNVVVGIEPIEEVDKESASPVLASKLIQVNGVKALVTGTGDSYRKIAQKYKIPLDKLLKYNDKSSTPQISTGAYVFLQPKRKKYRGKQHHHRVKTGENMASIAQKYGIKLASLYKRNKLFSGQEPAVGAKIYLRKKAKTRPKLVNPKPPKVTPQPVPGERFYTVEKGDTLWSIAQKHGIAVEKLKQLNDLDSNVIRVGQKLKVK